MTKRNQSIGRASRILKALGDSRSRLSLAEIGEIVGLPPSTVYRLLATLEEEGFVERDSDDNKYRLGLELFRLGSTVVKDMRLVREAYPLMQHVADACGETVNLGILRDFSVLYLEKIESEAPLRADLVVGGLVPAYCTALGKALLAHLPEPQLDELLTSHPLRKIGPNCITSPPQLKEELSRIRQRGYSTDDEEFSTGIRAIGAPIWNRRNQVIAGIAIAGPASRLSLERLDDLASLIVQAADDISKRLGYWPDTSV